MRNHLIDNAKGVLIFLVVLGHYLERADGWQNPVLSIPLTLIYMFHMPAFVFLAGITAKQDRLGVRVANLAIILVMFHIAYVTPVKLISGNYPVSLLQPYWMLWFLLSLIYWTLLLPAINRLPGALLISIIVAIGGGLISSAGYPLSTSRTLIFLPFFVAGHLYGNRILAASQKHTAFRILAIPALLSSATLIWWFGVGFGWLHGSMPYSRLGVDATTGCLIRSGLLALSALSVLALLACLTTAHSFLSRIGRSSLAIFTLHGFPAIIIGKIADHTLQFGDFGNLGLALLASVATTLALAHPSFDSAIRSMTDQILRFATEKAAPRRAAS